MKLVLARKSNAESLPPAAQPSSVTSSTSALDALKSPHREVERFLILNSARPNRHSTSLDNRMA
ncbi:hypothetical protein PG985_015904 [Apiospora marii]|uniref:uncharacterized protein n=1 Tax=Apiospora marii TaxID=335849 RepID=UPI00312E3495